MDRSIYDRSLDFFFNEASSLLGERGSLSSTVAALERGNASSGLFEEPLAKLEGPAYRHWLDQVEHERETRARFNRLNGLVLRLEPKPDDYDAWWADLVAKTVSGMATKAEESAIKVERALWVNVQQLLAAQYSTAGRRVLHLEARFGEIVGAVVFLAEGRDLMKMKMKEIAKLERQALYGVRAAHKEWRATRPKKDHGPRLYVPEAPVSSAA